jgi:hypothetical protein
MTEQRTYDELPNIDPNLVPGPNSARMRIDRYEQLRYLENKFVDNLLDHLDNRIADARSSASILFKALQGDKESHQQIKQGIASTGEALMNGISMEQVQKNLQRSMAEMKTAYEKGDLDTIAKLSSVAVIGMVDRKKNLNDLADLGKGKVDDLVGNAAEHTKDAGKTAKQPSKPWEGDTNPSQAHDPALMHGHQNGPVDIDGVRYENGKNPEIITHGPLELEPIDKPVAMPRNPHRSRPSTSASADDHTDLKAAVAIGTVAVTGAAVVAGKHHLEEEERKGRVPLSDAYKTATHEAWGLSEADRNTRYEAALKQHPELKEAIAGYEMVRQHAAKDGKITDNDKLILDLVASNTSIQILNGKVADIKVTANPFQPASQDADHQSGPSYGY